MIGSIGPKRADDLGEGVRVNTRRQFLPISAEQRLVLQRQRDGGCWERFRALAKVEMPTDLEAVAEAVRAVAAAHETLYAAVAQDAGEPVLERRQEPNVQIDACARPMNGSEVLQAAEVLPRLDEDLRVRFLIAPAEESGGHWVHADIPAVYVDRRSVELLLRQIASGTVGAGRTSISYADYAALQRELPCSAEFEEAAHFWSSVLAADGSSDEYSSPSAAAAAPSIRLDVAFGQDVVDSLRRCSETWKLPSRSILLAAWALLARRIGRPDIGLTLNEPDERLRNLVGPISRTLPASMPLDEDETLVSHCRATATALRRMEQWDFFLPLMPQQKMPEAVLDFSHEPAGEPPVCISFDEVPMEDASLRLLVTEGEGRLQAALFCRTNDWDPAAAARVAHLYPILLEQICREAGGDARNLKRASDTEVGLVRALASGPERLETPPLVVDSMRRAFERFAEAPALVDGQKVVTYGELDVWTGRMADAIARRVAPARTAIAVCMPRSTKAVCALIAAIRAGCAFVPVEPDQPGERIKAILAGSGAALVIHEDGVALPNVGIDAVGFSDLLESSGAMAGWARTQARDLAYIMHTSGSTGIPKGVRVSHANLAHYLDWAVRHYFGENSASMPLLTSLAFDLTITSLFCPLLTGGRIRVYDEMDVGEDILQAFGDPALTAVKLTPSHIDLLGQLGCPSTGVALAIVGGEALHPTQAEVLRGLNPEMRIVNEYGPTEATVGCVAADVPRGAKAITIGRPISDTQIYLLDESLVPVAFGEIGEIVIGGAGVTQGYGPDISETEERFIRHELAPPGARLYRTGDLGRLRMTGEFEYLGRADTQVKINGYRVELGEIESAVRSLPGIEGAAAVLRADADGRQQLVAFVTGTQREEAELLSALKRHLPRYMLPQRIVALSHLPRTANQKIDRGELVRRPLDPMSGVRADEPEPLDPMLRRLTEMWSTVLARKVAASASFLELGGDSIRAIRLVTLINRNFGSKIGIRDLYSRPSPAEMAEHLRGSDQAAADDVVWPGLKGRKGFEPLDRADVEEVFPASSISLGMIYQSLRDPALYHAQNVYEFHEPELDREIFRDSLAELVARHQALRSTFELSRYAEPVQIVWRERNVSVAFEDLSGLGADQQHEAINELLRDDLAHPFTPDSALLWRATLIACGEGHYTFLWVHHHAILDGWSNALASAELASIYRRRVRGEAQARPALEASLADYVVEQAAIRSNEDIRSFWRSELHGHRALKLFDEPVASPRVHIVERELGSACLARVRALARMLATDVRTVCFAAYVISLSRFDYYKDFVVGLVEHNRPLKADADKLLGCFLNTVPVRLRWDQPPTGAEIVRLCHRKLVEMKHYGRLPLTDIASSAGRTGASPVPFFETMFNFVDFSGQAAAWDSSGKGAKSSGLSFERTETVLDCTVSITDEEFLCRFVGLSRATPELTEQLAVGFVATLEGLLGDPQAAIAVSADAMPVRLSYAEGEAWPLEVRGAHELFARAVARDPDAIAAFHGDVAIRYGELHAAAAGLARHLCSIGLQPGDVVGIRLPRSIDYVSSLLGVMMAGGAFMALPPDYPPARLASMLADADCRWCITVAEFAPELDVHHLRTIVLDSDGLSMPFAAGAGITSPVEPDLGRIAYLVFTSGSTGTPKGVPITHAGLVNAMQAVARLFDVDRASRCLHFAALGFDMSIAEILRALSAGACLIIASDSERDVDQLAKLCRKYAVTHVEMPPTMLKLMDPEDFPTLTHIVAGGEQCPDELGRRWQGAGRRFFNAYGPTETSIYASTEEMGQAPITIGRPLPNLSALILDIFGQPMPVCGIGELCVGGVGVTRGYLARLELNRDRFLSFAEGQDFAGRYYRTGDFGRIGFDGRIRCYGRSDDQMSIHGQRIEPGEVEVALKAYRGIADAAVAPRRVADADMLVAFVVPAADVAAEALDSTPLRDHLAKLLPRHMRPTLFVSVPRIPLTSSGKTDRRALAELDIGAATVASRSAPASDDLEERVLGIWQEILPLKTVGIGDDLFTAGGDSLAAIRIVARINKEFGSDIRVEELVRAGSVALTAELVRDRLARSGGRLSPVSLAESYPLSHAQQRLWAHEQRFGASATPNLVSAYRIKGALRLDCVEAAILALIDRHEVLRTRIAVLEGEPRQHILETASVPVPLEHVRGRWDDVSDRISAASSLPLASDQAPLWRLFAYQTASDEWILQFIVSHLIGDAWSLDILVSDFALAYAEAYEGQLAMVPPPRVQFKDYACWQRTYAEAPDSAAEAFWRAELAGASRAVDVPYDRIAEVGAESAAATTDRTIAGELLERIARTSAESHVSEYSVALAAVYLCLKEETGKDDLVLGAPMNGRSFEELTDQIGFYVNIVPLRLRPAAEPCNRRLVHSVFSAVMSALSHQHYPLERIIAGVPGPTGGRGGMFDVGFDWTSVRDVAELPFKDLVIKPLPAIFPEHETRLWFSGVRSGDSLRLSLAYNASRYSRARADEMLDQVVRFLEMLVSDPAPAGDERQTAPATAPLALAFKD